MNNNKFLYIIIWILISLILVILYSFQYELTYFWERLKMNLMPREYTQSTQRTKIILPREQDGHFYINAVLNNVKIRFLIDTGASKSFLSINDAQSLGIDLNKVKFNRFYHTANGITQGGVYKVKKFQIGKITIENINVSIGKNYQGVSLLGMDVISFFDNFIIDNDHLLININFFNLNNSFIKNLHCDNFAI